MFRFDDKQMFIALHGGHSMLLMLITTHANGIQTWKPSLIYKKRLIIQSFSLVLRRYVVALDRPNSTPNVITREK